MGSSLRAATVAARSSILNYKIESLDRARHLALQLKYSCQGIIEASSRCGRAVVAVSPSSRRVVVVVNQFFIQLYTYRSERAMPAAGFPTYPVRILFPSSNPPLSHAAPSCQSGTALSPTYFLTVPEGEGKKRKTKVKEQPGPEAFTSPSCYPHPAVGLAPLPPSRPQSQPPEASWLVWRALSVRWFSAHRAQRESRVQCASMWPHPLQYTSGLTSLKPVESRRACAAPPCPTARIILQLCRWRLSTEIPFADAPPLRGGGAGYMFGYV